MSAPATTAGAPYSTREQRGWYVYDWANSAFSTTVVTLFLGPYLTALARAAADSEGYIHPLGLRIDARAYWGYLVALSVVLQVLILPLLGAIADYGRRKKLLLGLTAYTGAAATIPMYFLEGGAYFAGGLLFLIANVSFGASIVIYNAFLPEIAPPEQRDAVSSRGWGAGYLGGGLLLALNLALYMKASTLGLSEGHAVRISLASAGLWWAGFTVIPLLAIRSRHPARALGPGQTLFGVGISQLGHTLRDLRRYPETLRFLFAYLLYNDGIQAVIALASQFGNDELKIPMSALTMAILMVQFVAFFGAHGFNYLAGWWGAKRAVMLSLVIWTSVIVCIYAVVRGTTGFFVMAAVVGLVMGGSQALSRSMFAQMIPKGKEAEYFSLYEVSDKGTSWLSPLMFGLALQFTRSYRLAILSLIFFFVAGLLVLAQVDVRRAAEAVREAAPDGAGANVPRAGA